MMFCLSLVNAQDKQAPKADKGKAKAKTEKATPAAKTEKAATAGNVFVCDSKTATAYHNNKKCTGLSKCTAAVKEMSKADAEKAGKKPCKMCVK